MKVALLFVLSLLFFEAIVAQQSSRTHERNHSQNQKQKQTKTQVRDQKQTKIQNRVAEQRGNSVRQNSLQEQQNRQSGDKQKQEQKRKDEYEIAKEGVGLEGIIVGKSTMQDVISKFGKHYKWIVHKKYSYQMAYPNGLSFYICQNDKKKEVFDIEIKLPYKAKTTRGVILGKSTMEDVQRVYGKPATNTLENSLEYKGVIFSYVNQNGKKVITTIDIIEKKGLRQCKVAK